MLLQHCSSSLSAHSSHHLCDVKYQLPSPQNNLLFGRPSRPVGPGYDFQHVSDDAELFIRSFGNPQYVEAVMQTLEENGYEVSSTVPKVSVATETIDALSPSV